MWGKEQNMKKYEIAKQKLEKLLWNGSGFGEEYGVEILLDREGHTFGVILYGATYDIEELEAYGHATNKDISVIIDADLNVLSISIGYNICSDNYPIEHFSSIAEMEAHHYSIEELSFLA